MRGAGWGSLRFIVMEPEVFLPGYLNEVLRFSSKSDNNPTVFAGFNFRA
jgi:hypothetical protein